MKASFGPTRGFGSYLNEDGDDIETVRQVHAGDTEVYLVFKYTPVETIEDGKLRFTVPDDWSPPQRENPNEAGYTEIVSSANLEPEDYEKPGSSISRLLILIALNPLRSITV